ncbi:MAG: hypothetical protein GC185_06690 [Alphaproteobacteria bacterium]|nr:hypothetical protein [Alphaproteobacteria bacterium]
MAWKQSEDQFLESDVVKWTEAIWPPSSGARRRRKRPRPWGKQAVTGQIISIDGDYLEVKVLKSEIVENTIGSKLRPHKPGTVIKKKAQTLLKGGPERRLWSEEDVRDALHREM